MTYDTVGDHIVVNARCCRDWPVVPYMRIGRCGLCGERPVVTPKEPS